MSNRKKSFSSLSSTGGASIKSPTSLVANIVAGKVSPNSPSPSSNSSIWIGLRRYACAAFIFFMVVLISSVGYYFYLDQLYLVDETLDGDGLRELDITEKFTLRVHAPVKLDDLKEFVKEYTICKPVQHIQILWDKPHTPPPSEKSFTYLHTHSKVTVYQSPHDSIHDTLFVTGLWDIETQGDCDYFSMFTFDTCSYLTGVLDWKYDRLDYRCPYARCGCFYSLRSFDVHAKRVAIESRCTRGCVSSTDLAFRVSIDWAHVVLCCVVLYNVVLLLCYALLRCIKQSL